MSFETFVERRIREAQERGDFDDLPGAGKPLPVRRGPDTWLSRRLAAEDVDREALLPPALRLRKERERLAGKARSCATEAEVRELASGFNRQVAEVIRQGIGDGPNLPVHTVDVDELLAEWRSAHPPAPRVRAGAEGRDVVNRSRRRRRWWLWWRR